VFVSRLHVPEELVAPGWPFDLPVVRRLVGGGLRLGAPVTFLVGDNGTGKSTLVEGIAEAYGVDVRGGHAGRRYASSMPKGPLGEALRLTLTRGHDGTGRRGKGYFLRSETALGVFEFMVEKGVAGYAPDLMQRSHGESFLQIFADRFDKPGLYLLDEPESGLAFEALLRLTLVIHRLAAVGAQVICATHSPVLTAMPGAELLLLADDGITPVQWQDLELVASWRHFLADPAAFMRHLLRDP
jgi:predicted ATPase